MDATSLYVQLGRLAESMPDLRAGSYPPDTLRWLGKAYALVRACGDSDDTTAFKSAMDAVATEGNAVRHERAVGTVETILHRALALAEMEAPADVQGTFILTGNEFDALAAVGKVFARATKSLLIIDPYADEVLVRDFVPTAAEHVQIQVLSDEGSVRPSLRPAIERWTAQFPDKWTLEARLAPRRSLHDRLIIVDDEMVWIATQSFNAIARRSPASIVRVESEPASLKLTAYSEMWNAANPL